MALRLSRRPSGPRQAQPSRSKPAPCSKSQDTNDQQQKGGAMEPLSMCPEGPWRESWESVSSFRPAVWAQRLPPSIMSGKTHPKNVRLILTFRLYFRCCWAYELRLLLPSTEISFRSKCSSQLTEFALDSRSDELGQSRSTWVCARFLKRANRISHERMRLPAKSTGRLKAFARVLNVS